jgi:glycosyltransferase 2 family protein
MMRVRFRRMKKTLLPIIQALVTIAILWWVFHEPAKRTQMAAALTTAYQAGGLFWIGIGIAVYGVVELIATVRLQLLLRVQGIRIGWVRVGMLVMIGLFFNLFMLGAPGGDVVKIFYMLKETPDKKAGALLAILMDRVIGLLGLIAITLVMLWWRYDWLAQTPATATLLYSLLAIAGAALTAVVVSFLITGFGLVHKLPRNMPFHDKLVDVSGAYHAYARAWRPSLGAFGCSLLIHVGSFLVFYSAAKAFTDLISLADTFAVMPVVNCITALPISLSGIGLREKLFEELLALSHVAPATAVLISLTGFMTLVFWCLLGGVLYMFYRPSEHARLRDITRDVAQIEHEIAEKE